MGLFSSKGLKRSLSTVLGSVLVLLGSIPVIGPMVAIPSVVVGVLGLTGLAHAATTDTLTQHAPATIGAILSILYAATEYIPALQPYAPIIKWLLTATGGVVVSKGIATN